MTIPARSGCAAFTSAIFASSPRHSAQPMAVDGTAEKGTGITSATSARAGTPATRAAASRIGRPEDA